MPRKSISFELDFMIKDILPKFTVKQFDDISFNIKPKKQGLDYDTTGMTGKIFIGVNNDMFMQTKNITVSNNNVNILLDRNMLQKNGRAYAEVELTDSNGTITSSSFIFNIDAKIGEGATIPGSIEGFVAKYERLISEFKSQVNETISNCNTNINSTINNCNKAVDNKLNDVDSFVDNKILDIETRFNTLTSKQQQDAEVIDARDGETSLKARLDRDIEKAKQVYVNVEGSHIYTDSSVGYLKDVEILGNTIQSASNLADIRSVGDKVEGQELYEIPVLSRGKNLNSGFELGDLSTSDGTLVTSSTKIRSIEFIKIDILNNYNIHINGINEGFNVYCYNDAKDFLGLKTKSNGLFVSSDFLEGTKYVKFVKTSTDTTNIQLEEGTVATPYEPYQEDKLTILSPVQLEKVGDVADRIIEKDGVWGVEKNIGNYIFKGNEIDYKQGVVGDIHLWYWSGANRVLQNKNNETTVIHTKLPHKKAGTSNTGYEAISFNGNGKNLLFDTKQSMMNEANEFISGSKLMYILATPQFIPLPHSQQVKLRTFANKTNISFGCEIEGTIKAQVPKSLGATVNTHTEQINNLNKELDRVKKLEESTVSTVETESDFTTVEATNGGYFEDVKLEGKTLVNLANFKGNFDGRTLTSTSVGFYIDDTKLLRELEVGKQYTLVNLCKFSTNENISRCEVEYIDNLGEKKQLVDFKNKNSVSFIVPADYTEFKQIFVYRNSTISNTMNLNVIILEGDHTQNPPSYFEGLKSVGQDVEEVSVASVNSDETQSDKKRLLYYNEETQTWEKPILRQWDSIEKHADGKYYYHQRSGETVLNGSEGWSLFATETDVLRFDCTDSTRFKNILNSSAISDKFNYSTISNVEGINFHASVSNRITVRVNSTKLPTQDVAGFKQWLQANNVTVVYQLAQEKVYECTNIDLITYANETNYVVNSGAIVPRTTLKVHNNISNVVSLLQKKVSLLESNIKASQEVQDMMILETDMRMLDIELALMEFIPMKLNLGGSDMLRSATYFNFLKNHIINETYEKEYLENVMNKYLATGRINQDEYNELYKMLYPPVYDIELPIEY